MRAKPLILVADDNAPIRKMLGMVLTRSGYDVVEADNGRSAVDLAALHHPDLLLLDIHMPQLDGVEALREIRGIEGLGGTPAIMLSGLSQPDEVAASARAGASDYIIKMGFDLKAFLARIRKALTGQPA